MGVKGGTTSNFNNAGSIQGVTPGEFIADFSPEKQRDFAIGCLENGDIKRLNTILDKALETNPQFKLNLSGADLAGLNLRGAHLKNVDLGGANFSGTNLQRSDLSGANLTGAAFWKTDLQEANLSGATLTGSYFMDPKIYGLKLDGAKDAPSKEAMHLYSENAMPTAGLGLNTVEGAHASTPIPTGKHHAIVP